MEKLEIACFNTESALIAQANGADRIEFCADFALGGTTPDFETTKLLRDQLHIPMTIMIRPRGGDFLYSDAEFEMMKNDIKRFQTLNVDGFVFGILTDDGRIDQSRNKDLVQLAGPVPSIMHRAFDRTQDMHKAFDTMLDCGFQTVLTSGHAPNVDLGVENLKTLLDRGRGVAFDIMPGGGLRSTNLPLLRDQVKCPYYHSSAIKKGSEVADPDEVSALKSILEGNIR